jgi:hypothetical protein
MPAAEVRWADALAWAALSAAGIVVAKLITRRGAESAYRVVLGAPPPRVKSKAEKKAEKKAGKHAEKPAAQQAA